MKKTLNAFFPLYSATVLMLLGSGLLTTYISLRLTAIHVSGALIGAIIAANYIGLVIGGKVGHFLIARVGHIRAYVACAGIITAAVLSHGLTEYIPAWVVLRLIIGLCMMCQFMVLESWLNDQAASNQRGIVFGVYMAATMGSETTAAITGQVGVVRRDPFAMIAFAGYNMSDYFQHWLNIGKKLEAEGAKLPKIYLVNWFRKDENGKFIWPGFGENMRVLSWILGRAEKTAGAQETPVGHSPGHADLNWNGLSLSVEQFHKAIAIQADDWKTELDLHQELFDKLAHRLPIELIETRAKLQQRFGT